MSGPYEDEAEYSADLEEALEALLRDRVTYHTSRGLSGGDAEREALLDVEVWRRALDEGVLEFIEWIPTGEERRPEGKCPAVAAEEQLTGSDGPVGAERSSPDLPVAEQLGLL